MKQKKENKVPFYKRATDKLKKFVINFIEDILIVAGFLLINIATYKISLIAGMYVTGSTLLALGIYFAKFPIKRG